MFFLIAFVAFAQKLEPIIIIFSLPCCVVGGRGAKLMPGNDVKPRAQRAALGAGALLPRHVPGQVGSPAGVLAVHARAGAQHPSHQGPGVGQTSWDPPGQRWGLVEHLHHLHFGGVLPGLCTPRCRRRVPDTRAVPQPWGRAPESKMLPIALSSLTGHRDFFFNFFFSRSMNGFCCKL